MCRDDDMVQIHVGTQLWILPVKQVMGVENTEGTEGMIKRPDWKLGEDIISVNRIPSHNILGASVFDAIRGL